MPRFPWFRLVLMCFPRRQLSRCCCLPACNQSRGSEVSWTWHVGTLGQGATRPLLLFIISASFFSFVPLVFTNLTEQKLICNSILIQSTWILDRLPFRIWLWFYNSCFLIVLFTFTSFFFFFIFSPFSFLEHSCLFLFSPIWRCCWRW